MKKKLKPKRRHHIQYHNVITDKTALYLISRVITDNTACKIIQRKGQDLLNNLLPDDRYSRDGQPAAPTCTRF